MLQEKCIILDESFGVANGVENHLWYIREDFEVNSQHWYWHQNYPFKDRDAGPRPDRRGEIFYHFHQTMLARYYYT
jgi:hypothetical protein